MPHDPRVSYGVAVIIPRLVSTYRHILMIKRKGSHAAGTWSVPGGWVDYGEQATATVQRECLEEVGIEVKSWYFLTYRDHTHVKEGVQAATLVFVADDFEGEPQILEPDKIEELRWVDLDDPNTWPKPLFPRLESTLFEYVRTLKVYDEI